MLLAVDPGNDAGWAVFDSARRLTMCDLDTAGRGRLPPRHDYTKILVEVPRYRGRFEKNPQALMTLSFTAGLWAGRYESCGPVHPLIPNAWKGQTPKEVSHRRVLDRLSLEERRVLALGCTGLSPRLPPIEEAIGMKLSISDKRANILDAIGIGLFGVGR